MLVLGYRLAVFLVDAGRPSAIRAIGPRHDLIVGPILWAIGTYATYQWHVNIVPDTTNEAFRKGIASISTFAASANILGQMMQPLGILLIAYAYRTYRSPFLLPVLIAIVILQVLLDLSSTSRPGHARRDSGHHDLRPDRRPAAQGLAGRRRDIRRSGLSGISSLPNGDSWRPRPGPHRGDSEFGKVLQLTLAAEDKVNSGRDRAQTFFERSSLKGSTEMIVDETGTAWSSSTATR